jgi:nitrogen fixation protein FixH
MSAARPFTLTGWHVLSAFTAFFLAIIVLDVGFAVLAYRTFPGQQAANPYEAGLAYNRTLAQHRAQETLGWRVEVARDQGGVEFRFLDRSGAPLRGLTVSGRAERPATESGAEALTFAEATPGVFRTRRPGPGAWDIEVTGRDADGRLVQAERRLTWP